jgi:hypothetical protein
MARFIIENKVYDTSKMKLIGKVKKFYEYDVWLLEQIYGKGCGRNYDCELYRSDKGNWLITHNGDHLTVYGEAITEEEAKSSLKKYDYKAYVKEYGELEEA